MFVAAQDTAERITGGLQWVDDVHCIWRDLWSRAVAVSGGRCRHAVGSVGSGRGDASGQQHIDAFHDPLLDQRGAPFVTVLRSVEVWAVPYYLAGGVLANVWTHVPLTARTGLTIVAAVSVYLLSVCTREVSLMIGEGNCNV
jgi:hypothetical protein